MRATPSKTSFTVARAIGPGYFFLFCPKTTQKLKKQAYIYMPKILKSLKTHFMTYR